MQVLQKNQLNIAIGIVAVAITVLFLWLLIRRARSAKNKNSKKHSARRKLIPPDTPERIAEIDYQLVTERILHINGLYKTVLFAGAGLDTLPITVPVNTAIQLAANGNHTLLIDLDTKRNALAAAFGISDELNPKDFRPRPYKTAFENLHLWPAHHFTRLKQMAIKPLAKAAEEKFDLVLINAPYLTGSPDRKQIASAAKCALLFANNTHQTKHLTTLLKTAKCKLIGNIRITTTK